MKLKLDRPLAFIDIEASGLDTQLDKIIELSITKLFPNGERENRTWRFNPGIHIPEKSTEIHGIRDEDVANEKSFEFYAGDINFLLSDSDIAGFNSNRFDVPILYAELSRAGFDYDYISAHMLDVGNLFKIQEPRTLEAAVRFYLGREHEGSHGAKSDTDATLDVFLAQVEKYPDLPQTIEELSIYTNYGNRFLDLSGKFSFDESGDYIFTFGKPKGEKVKNDMGFLNWILSKDFTPDTLEMARKIRDEILYSPVKKETNDWNLFNEE